MFEVSIIMPVYNVAEHLPRAIESALAQKNGVCEIILVNDGSPDASGAICDEYAEKEPLLITVIHQENQGSGPARNTGLEKAKGDYIYFADPDDYFNAYLVADNSRVARKNQPDCVVFGYTQEKAVDAKNREVHLPNLPQMDTQEDIRTHFRNIYHFSPYALWNKLYKKAFLMENGIRFGTQRQGQDALFNIDVYKQISSIAVNRKVYCHHVNSDYVSRIKLLENRNDDIFKVAHHFDTMVNEWQKEYNFEDLIAEEYFNAVCQFVNMQVNYECELSTNEKVLNVKNVWEKVGSEKILPFKSVDSNPIRYAVFYELKSGNYRNTLFLMKMKNSLLKQASKPIKIIKKFFRN